MPFEAFAADVQTLTSDLLLAQSGDRVLFIGLRATPTWSSWNGDPGELLLGPLRIAATSVFFHKEQLPRFDSVAVAYNDPVGTAVEMTAEDFDAYGRGAMTDEQALARVVISGSP